MIDHRARVHRPRKKHCLAAGLVLACFGGMTSLSHASGLVPDSSSQAISFSDRGISTGMHITTDGQGDLLAVSGNNTTGQRLTEYDASGNYIASYSPGLDFRSIFADGSGTVFASAYNSRTIYKQTSLGVFSSYVTLTGGTLNSQSDVVLDSSGTHYIAMSGGQVSTWDLSGAYIGTTSLVGFGSLSGENTMPSNRGIAVAGGTWLTYDASNETVSVWDPATGARIGETTLSGAGTGTGAFSFSYTNGEVFVLDQTNGLWRGYPLNPTPPPTNTATATVTDTPTNTPVPPTDTPTSTATATDTSAPAANTATSTPAQPTNTPTATATAVPTGAPSATAAPPLSPTSAPVEMWKVAPQATPPTPATPVSAPPFTFDAQVAGPVLTGTGAATRPHTSATGPERVLVQLATSPRAPVTLRLALTHSSVVTVRHDGRHQLHGWAVRTLYATTIHTAANGAGHVQRTLTVAYTPSHALVGRLTLSARTPRGTLARGWTVHLAPHPTPHHSQKGQKGQK